MELTLRIGLLVVFVGVWTWDQSTMAPWLFRIGRKKIGKVGVSQWKWLRLQHPTFSTPWLEVLKKSWGMRHGR